MLCLFLMPLQIVNDVLYFCKSSKMFTRSSCFLSPLYWGMHIYFFCVCVIVGGERNRGGEFLFSEKGDGAISLTFILLRFQSHFSPFLMYLLIYLQDWQLIWLAAFIYGKKDECFKMSFSSFFHSASETPVLCEGWKHSFGQVPMKLCLKYLHNDTKIQVMSGVTR